MRLIYLEAGSGAEEPIPPKVVSEVRNAVQAPLIVGGGIRSGEAAAKAVRAGADIIVTGTIVEQSNRVEAKIREIVKAVRASGRHRLIA
jgi:phosphoglycerol geranylgeranyltransferase